MRDTQGYYRDGTVAIFENEGFTARVNKSTVYTQYIQSLLLLLLLLAVRAKRNKRAISLRECISRLSREGAKTFLKTRRRISYPTVFCRKSAINPSDDELVFHTHTHTHTYSSSHSLSLSSASGVLYIHVKEVPPRKDRRLLVLCVCVPTRSRFSLCVYSIQVYGETEIAEANTGEAHNFPRREEIRRVYCMQGGV